ncbi:hypothetical protein F9C07_13260 [Aspergillus flavus]|uniref:Uncharacterized protein n=1 Tax=Aspergillus flavus (strain ATCC 200026 / FGSC A1120 / IAM 13836 / NRRL 3357 / JCM 12722 / SRRC 167) TaxID=332952 RepID=A0A7U2MZZ7_ASPFN|nr:hypothetical protein F9C07_13260 [Aspergillus flavus]
MISYNRRWDTSSQHARSFECYDVGLPSALLPHIDEVVSITNINSIRDPNCAHIFGPAVAFPT